MPVVNRKACLQLAAFLRLSSRFDMAEGVVSLDCGSAGCVGAHAAVLWPELRKQQCACETCKVSGYFTWSPEAFCEKLGITSEQERELCFLSGNNELLIEDVTRLGAVATLERLAETGVVTYIVAEQIPDPHVFAPVELPGGEG